MPIVIFSCDNEIPMSAVIRPPLGPNSVTPAVRWAGFLGLMPFVFTLGLVTIGAPRGMAPLGLQIATAWGAVILTFIGAVHWGLALAGRLPWSVQTIVASTSPSVVGVMAILIAGERGMAILIAGFGLFWLYENRTHAEILPADYLDLRRVLTLCVCTLLVLTAFAASGVAS